VAEYDGQDLPQSEIVAEKWYAKKSIAFNMDIYAMEVLIEPTKTIYWQHACHQVTRQNSKDLCRFCFVTSATLLYTSVRKRHKCIVIPTLMMNIDDSTALQTHHFQIGQEDCHLAICHQSPKSF